MEPDNIGDLNGRMVALSQQVDRWLEDVRGINAPAEQTVPLFAATEALNVTLEELQVAQEELYQQNHELTIATEAVEAERQRYQDLFEFAPDGYLVTSVVGRIQEVNRAAAALFGVGQKYLTGKPLSVFIAPDDRHAFRTELTRLLQDKQRQEWIIRFQPRRPKREAFYAAVTVAAILDPEQQVVGFRWLLRDITERQQLEEARLSIRLSEMANQSLRAEIERREALEQTLHQQAVALSQANRMKDQFLAIVSHELRSPLNPILGWSQLLQAGTLSTSDTDRALETIQRNARLQAQLIDDLLDISRIVRGKLSLNMQPLNLTTVLEAAIDTVQLAASARAIDLRTRLDGAGAFVMGDPDRLQQVIWNLLTNAIKFTPIQGRVELKLEPSTTEAIVTVSDTGCGISPELLPYLFEQFWQAERVTTRSHGGLGLGLNIARHLVEMHGGTIQATSPGIDQGATFTLRLPLNAGAQVAPAAAAPNAPPRLDYLQVLIVDDQPDAREVVCAVLKQAGAVVTSAGSVAQALAAIAQRDFQILISDIGMPQQDGYALIRQVRATSPSLPAIALTAYVAEGDRQEALAAGFDAHLSKPIELEKLLALVARLANPL